MTETQSFNGGIVMEGHNIQFVWDNEAKVWIATSEDIPGLILEDESADKLIQRVILAAPEIIELNSMEKKQTEILPWTEKSSHGIPPTKL